MAISGGIAALSGEGLLGREYLRVSHDRSGRLRSVTEQAAENKVAAERFGLSLGEPYAEAAAVGASRHSRGERAEFDRLLRDLTTGRFGARVLVMWETSRGSRKVSEWARLIELCEEQGVFILASAGGGRLYDPSDARDRRSLHEDATDAEYEAAKISQRTRRAARANAAAGRPHGAAPWGYRPVYDQRTGKLATWAPDPDRAPVVRALFTRLRAGVSFVALEREFAGAGVVNKSGRPFKAQQLREMARRPAYAGMRRYEGQAVDATWEAIVDPALFWDVQQVLAGAAHQAYGSRPGRVAHEFTGAVVCGAAVSPVNDRGAMQYRCKAGGCVRIDKEQVDDLLRGVLLGYLARPDTIARLSAAVDSPQAEQAALDLSRLRAELADAQAAVPDTLAEVRLLARLVDGLTVKVSAAETRLRELTTPSALLHLIAPGDDVTARWQAAPVSARHKAATLLFTPALIGQPRITRSSGHRQPVEERVHWHRDTPPTGRTAEA